MYIEKYIGNTHGVFSRQNAFSVYKSAYGTSEPDRGAGQEVQICLSRAFFPPSLHSFSFLHPFRLSVSHHTTRSLRSNWSLSCSILFSFRHRRMDTQMAKMKTAISTAPPMPTARITISEKGAGKESEDVYEN